MNTRASFIRERGIEAVGYGFAAYKTLYTIQLLRLFPPGKSDTIRMLLRRFAKERRLYLSKKRNDCLSRPEIPAE